MPLEQHDKRLSAVDGLPTDIGSGWLSGVLSIVLGTIGLGAVLCFLFPERLTMIDVRPHYPVPILRGALHVVLVLAFLLGLASACLRPKRGLGFVGMGSVLIAALLGGSQVPLPEGEFAQGPFLGLDWFLLNLIVFSAVFIPMERLFARLPEQPVFRRGWVTDATYFFISTLAVQVTTILTLKPATVLFSWMVSPTVHAFVQSIPWIVQFLVIMFAVDLVQYWLHRTFHTVPFLWKFHAVHHSTDAMDWLASSRLHVIEQVITRACTFLPAYVLGFSDVPVFAYIIFITFHSTFIHANVRWDFGPLRYLFVSPQFHHWHHAIEREAIDKNFAVHFPFLDLLFGTWYLPKEWPTGYGIHDQVPKGWLRQLIYPFTPKSWTVAKKSDAVEVHS